MNVRTKVFISYSHDSNDHKKWVASLAYVLIDNGIDVILDQWDCNYGGELTRFMLNSIKTADRVLMICTDKYIEKANAGKSGVGYEGMIITSEIYQDIESDKFIPIVRNVISNKKHPNFLGTRLYIDFSSDERNEREEGLRNLLIELNRINKEEVLKMNGLTSDFMPFTKKRISFDQQRTLFANIGGIVFAAGKSTRMKSPQSKMLEQIDFNGKRQPMIYFCIDLLQSLGIDSNVLYGFDGTNVLNHLTKHPMVQSIFPIRVCKDDGSDLTLNTGGNLKNNKKIILKQLDGKEHVLLTVADQPYVTKETILDFINYYISQDLDACLLTVNARGNEQLEKSTSTRVSFICNELIFNTPPKDHPFDPNIFSSLLDVGVVIIKKSCFEQAINLINEADIFGKIIKYISPRADGKLNVDIYEEFENIDQFLNINYHKDIVKTNILDDWIRWNVDFQRKKHIFNITDYGNQYKSIIELDTTLICSTTPACASECTYRNYRDSKKIINIDLARKALNYAKENDFYGVLFSGGGENLQPESYSVFIDLLCYAKDIGLSTHLATNGLYFNEENSIDLISKLDSIRFSINPLSKIELANLPPSNERDKYSHLGVIADKIILSTKIINKYKYPTQVIANVLLNDSISEYELESSIMMLSSLGVNVIRVKPRHVYFNGKWDVDPTKYVKYLPIITDISQRKELALPIITIPKLEGILMIDSIKPQPEYCWYNDFNPITIGCDNNLYACCEMKYDRTFMIGNMESINALDFGKSRLSPQKIYSKKCFRGCKGYVLNYKLQKLLNEYSEKKETLFQEEQYKRECKIILESITRITPDN